MFLLFTKACLLYKTSNIGFNDFFSQSMTWEYSGLQVVTGCYRGLQGVTVGDKGLQGVTKDYTNFFLTRTFLHSFSWFILHKNQS